MTDIGVAVAETVISADAVQQRRGISLDVGCGAAKQSAAWVGMDHQALPGVDIVHNWDNFPWPLESESCFQILASHVVEHVNPVNGHFIDWMNECWRILQPGGRMAIVCPYATSHGYFQDPTHVNPCNETTWAYFDPEHPTAGAMLWAFYKPKPWRIVNLYWDVGANMEVVLEKRGDVYE